ncbi:RsmB/NOP family class I SAM-dependent RNA methyltransferase [Patescibacteria group bacterium]|nr:RsmB/NOP family class I SAM-dependent RNA methyltransferase [Patescibacteria group bacterium]MBU1896021.1 RsmB/NOP family class I SAM-dependent RNA methyltransferase [Patescibacteria group bacterium]
MYKNKRKVKTLPEDFISRLTDIFGPSLFLGISKTFVERPITFRVNTIKVTREKVLDGLRETGFKVKNVLWYRDAFILQNKTKRELIESDLYSSGKIYLQSLASMIPPLVLDPKPGERVLDLTAAPGSKTSQMAGMMELSGELVACDNNETRFAKLKHNLELLGAGSFVKLKMLDGTKLCQEYTEYFDKILLDAPCGAEVRFVLDEPRTFSYWQERKIKDIAYQQRKLLLSAWSALKPGGTLVYSTCTFAPEENEIQVTKFLEKNTDAKILAIDLPDLKRAPIVKEWKGRLVDTEVVKKALRIMPDREIEGFFVVKIKKYGNL